MSRASRTPPEAFLPLVSAIEDLAVRELFTYRFLVAAEIYDELIDAASHRILAELGALPGDAGISPAGLAEERHLPPRSAPILRFLFAKLADAGILEARGGRYFPGSREAGRFEALVEELAAREPAAAVGSEVVSVLVENAPAFFAGERSGEEILFAPNRLPLWFRYFSNENLLYAINNTLGAEALSRALPGRGGQVLEVGGGCGSAAEEALRKLGPRIARYRFTELVPTFARRGERAARAAASPETVVEAGKLDMNRPWAGQGIEPASFDAVYSVNCFHIAPDLDAVLREARAALRPGGTVVVSECVRPTRRARPIYVEFVFDFLESFTNVKTDPVRRPTHGFLTPAAWRASFEAAGFGEVTLVPDVDRVAERYPDFVVGAVVARLV